MSDANDLNHQVEDGNRLGEVLLTSILVTINLASWMLGIGGRRIVLV